MKPTTPLSRRRRLALHGAACAALVLPMLSAGPATAQDYPTRPVKIVVTFPTGGAPDILARLISSNAGMGQTVVVDNRPGAGGNIGAEIVAKSPADGYTLVMGTVGTHSINGSLFERMPYDMVKDFEPVMLLASTPNLLVVNNDLPVKNVQDLIAWGKANPNKLSFGSPGVGTSIHVSGELFKTMTGVQMAHVPYKGRQFAIPDLVGGQIHLMFDNMPSALPMVKEGKLRALGQTGAKRSSAAPDVPTIAEQGLPEFEATSWFAVFAPAGTPKQIIAKWHAELKRIFTLPEVAAKLQTLGLDPVLSSPQELAAFQASEIRKWTKVVKDSGAKAN
jgi:tripartite-type tricarboxylate transporter receptor subunit TctC